MATINEFYSQGQGNIDLGLSVGGFSLVDDEFVFFGDSDSANAFFLHPFGYSFDFTRSGDSTNRLYLTGDRSTYTAFIADGQVTLTKGTRGEPDYLSVTVNQTQDVALVFDDGFLKACSVTESGGEPLDNSMVTTAAGTPNADASSGSVPLIFNDFSSAEVMGVGYSPSLIIG